MDAPVTLRRRVFELLDHASTGHLSRIIDAVLIASVVISVSACVLESVPSLAAAYGRLFSTVEVVCVAIFTVEYLVRLWCAPEHALHGQGSSWRARLIWATGPQPVVDLIAVAPALVGFFVAADLKSLLILRLFRFFKLARYSPGIASLFDAIYAERRALVACAVILVGIVLLAASAMHWAEQDSQPDKLGTIPDAMYWAFVTLATVGYGDVVPVTTLGKLIASCTAVVGIIMLALPVGILASAFADEIRRRDFVVTWTMVAKVPIFADLDAADLSGIMRFLKARSWEAGQAIVRRGEPARSMFFITSGDVTVDIPNGAVRLAAGDFFGEMALLHGRERNATVSAASRVRLLELEASDLQYLMDQTPQMAERIREVARDRAEGVGEDERDLVHIGARPTDG